MKKLALFSLALFTLALAAPAVAFDNGGPNGYPRYNNDEGLTSIVVTNYKEASVMNMIKTEAKTGDNEADGGDSGYGGDGGSVACSEDNNIGGAGGAGGAGGDGGIIVTGAAIARTSLTNVVNTDRTVIEPACLDCENGQDLEDLTRKIRVHNTDIAKLMNGIETEAETGDNEADGGDAQDGGNGGSVTNSDDGNGGGAGGAGGAAGWGGQIQSGPSTAETTVVNRINRIVNRIRY